FLQLAGCRFGWRFEDIAFHVVLTAVIDTPQDAVFVAAKKQRSAAMGTVLGQKADASLSIAKRNQVLAEQTHALGSSVGFGNFLREERGNPIVPQHIAHRRSWM